MDQAGTQIYAMHSFGDTTAAAEHYEFALKSQAVPDPKTLTHLSHIYSNLLQQPNVTVFLLQPYLQPPSDGDDAGADSSSTAENTDLSASLRSDVQLSCAYLQALVQSPSHSQQMLQYLEALRAGNVSFDACIYYAQHQVLIARRYYADAYQTSVEFVRAYPTLYQAHTAMGEALWSLQRTSEATAVLRVAHSLVDAQVVQATLPAPMANRNATLDPLVRLGDALYACGTLTEAASLYTLVTGLLQPSELAAQCALMSRVAQLHQKLGNYAKAYVASLQCVKYCPQFSEGYLHLGNAQHRLGLLHDASTSLQVAARSKALKKEARAQLKAVKATEDAQLKKQAREDEEKLGPQPPLDPNIKRQEPKGLYIDFLAQLQKEKEEKEKLEKESVARQVVKVGAPAEAAGAAGAAGVPAPHPVSSAKPAVKDGAAKEAEEKGISESNAIKQQINPAGEMKETIADEKDEKTQDPSEGTARALAEQYIAYAKAFIAQGNPSEALKKLKVAIKKAPRYADAYLARGDLHTALGDIASATADYLKVYMELDPSNATCEHKVHNIVLQMVRAGQTTEGVALLNQMGHRPVLQEEKLAMDLATVLAQQKEYKVALLVLYSINPVVPSTAQRIKLIANMLEGMDLIVRASETLYSGIFQNLTTYEDLGEMYMRHNNYTMAIKAFEEGLSSSLTSSPSVNSDASSMTTRLHAHLAQAYLALYEEAQTAAAEEVSFDIEGSNGQAEPTTVPDREHLNKAVYHYQQADKFGVFNAEMRKFYAQYPEFVPTASVPLDEQTHSEPAARSHPRPRWLSRRSTNTAEETGAEMGSVSDTGNFVQTGEHVVAEGAEKPANFV
eukprot:gene10394-12153_t